MPDTSIQGLHRHDDVHRHFNKFFHMRIPAQKGCREFFMIQQDILDADHLVCTYSFFSTPDLDPVGFIPFYSGFGKSDFQLRVFRPHEQCLFKIMHGIVRLF